jgi:hypothetical protein
VSEGEHIARLFAGRGSGKPARSDELKRGISRAQRKGRNCDHYVVPPPKKEAGRTDGKAGVPTGFLHI